MIERMCAFSSVALPSGGFKAMAISAVGMSAEVGVEAVVSAACAELGPTETGNELPEARRPHIFLVMYPN
jgi:hypothetical protein